MKIKKNYVIRTIGEDIVVVPIRDEAVRFNGIITLNKTGEYLFKTLQSDNLTFDELLEKVLNKYDVSKDLAQNDIKNFIKKCKNNGLIDEEKD